MQCMHSIQKVVISVKMAQSLGQIQHSIALSPYRQRELAITHLSGPRSVAAPYLQHRTTAIVRPLTAWSGHPVLEVFASSTCLSNLFAAKLPRRSSQANSASTTHTMQSQMQPTKHATAPPQLGPKRYMQTTPRPSHR
jgi:hypothetical protein